MKKILALSLFFACFVTTYAQEVPFSQIDKSPLDVVLYRNNDNQAIARVIYSRPAKRDREIFGTLVPYNKVWRTGANEASEIDFFKDVMINNQLIKAGSYSIFTIPQENEWTFILNSQTNQWGTNYIEEHNVIKTPMSVMPSPQSIENFSISFVGDSNEFNLFMGWDNTITSLPIEVVN